jgi:hypothetical protein
VRFPLAQGYLSGAQFLEHYRAQLNDAQCGLAPSDDGVDTRTVSVVRTDSAVAIAVERHGIATATTFALARNEIDEWIIKCLFGGIGVHG